jgi:serine/threonine-protein kinase SRPK3
MARLENSSILEKSALHEFENPLPQKVLDDRTIYLSRNQYGPPEKISKVLGIITITDFGFAVEGHGPHYGPIQAGPFRAPEVILDAGWSYSTDIWNLGVMVWILDYLNN